MEANLWSPEDAMKTLYSMPATWIVRRLCALAEGLATKEIAELTKYALREGLAPLE